MRYGAVEMTVIIINIIIYDVICTDASSAGLVYDDIHLLKEAAPMIFILFYFIFLLRQGID